VRAFIEQYGFLVVLAPLLGAAINGLAGRSLQRSFGERATGLIANAAVFAAFMVAVVAFAAVWSAEADAKTIVCHLFNWLNVGAFRADVSLVFDPLSTIMILVVTGIGFLIHVYSTGYMQGDPGYYRFFAYLNLFIFSMLILVLGENMLLMFVGWEGVGLCSYLLISFWYTDKANALAGNKAFIVNRVGDLGFILGMLLLYSLLKEHLSAGALAGAPPPSLLSFRFLEMNIQHIAGAEFFGIGAVTLICLCLFVGATGKSAQIPLFVWLPDAMAGPTPVSALIHAATMVTAGVYMIGRLHFLFSLSAPTLEVIAVIGATTALFAATIGCVQNDIKKVLAYSTISQLGYMFLGMGVVAYSAGIFHLMTHAFFKACLFLGAGSVILGLHHEQDIRWMGGLRKKMPRTFATFLLAALALSGVPPFSGFFSKDEILWQAWKTGHQGLWFMGFCSAGITAFYMTRLVVLTFFGANRLHQRPAQGAHPEPGEQDHEQREIRESSAAITAPLLILAFFSVSAGCIGIPAALGGGNRFAQFLVPVFGGAAAGAHHDPMEYLLMAASATIAFAGIGAGVWFYWIRPELPGRIAARFRTIHGIVAHKYYVDEVYDVIFVAGTKLLAQAVAAFDRYVVDFLVDLTAPVLRLQAYLAGVFDRTVVDGFANVFADGFLFSGGQLRRLQTGIIQTSVLLFFVLVILGVSFVVFM